MDSQYEKLKKILREMFQMDQADLDFGIYRIMNQKRQEIEKFLDKDLLPQVKEQFSKYRDVQADDKKKKLAEMEKSLRDAEVDPETNPKVIELRKDVSAFGDDEALANEVFSHLATFFRRYYDGGDFLSLRRYKKDTYAIPYEGEEVKLYWANHDQYYIKSSEFLRDYTFKLSEEKRVHFKLVNATQEKDNVKELSGKERRFKLHEEEPIVIDGNELFIQFVFVSEKEAQKKLNEETLASIGKQSGKMSNFMDIFRKEPTEKNPNRTVLEKHLNTYTARFNFDFFIHKDLEGFLKREMDFYVKNEVLFVDDLDDQDINKLKGSVAKVKVIKHIAHKIITMLGQLEDFQKKLWLKKKFVTQCGYCVTLDRVPEELYVEVSKNEAQIEEWIKLYAIDAIEGDLAQVAFSKPLTIEFLKANPNLMLDTKHFDDSFTQKLLSSFDDLDEQCDGLIINSENFQALNLLQEKYQEQVKCIYIDPPYNAQSSEIIYKNDYKHSSWLSLLQDRILGARALQLKNGVFTIAIDEVEQELLGQLISRIYPDYQKDCISIVHNPSGQQGDNFSFTHEYAYFVYPKPGRYISEHLRRSEEDWDERNFRDVTGDDSLRKAGPNCFYPILIKNGEVIGFGDVCAPDYHPNINEQLDDDVVAVYPVDPEGIERKWRFARNTVEEIKEELKCHFLKKRNVFDIKRLKKVFNFKSIWVDSCYSANNHGTQLLNNIVKNSIFTYPKSIFTVMDSINAGLNNHKGSIVLDYFAGSGTTAHAVINLNREDDGKRKYILVEMGQYFDTVLKPRIQKVVYSKNWKDGKPVSREGSSHMFKYMILESYEDALDNLLLKRSDKQNEQLEHHPQAREDYLLKYFLDVESRGSASLLNIEQFTDPFNYKLKIRQDDQLQDTKIDLVETFNYLIGLYVQHIDWIKGFLVIQGKLRTGEKTLVIWRNCKDKSNDDLDNFFESQAFNPKDFEFDLIFVNGDNNLQNLKKDEENFKVRLIEEEFHKRMFDVRDV